MDHQLVELDGGLRLLMVPMRDVESVTTMIFVGSGSRYETSEISGVSHFLEHMFFKGTQNRRSSLEISEAVDSVGGEFNAGTSKEYTVYYIKARSKHVDLSIDILSDMMLNPLFDSDELDREKGVILEELKMYEDTPLRDIADVYEQVVWGDQPLGWKVIGNKEAIADMTRDRMVKYKQSLYTKDNMIIGIAGKFDPEQVTKDVSASLATLQVGKSIQWVDVEDDQKVPNIHVVPKKTEQAHLCLGLRGYAREHPDRYALRVLNVLLGANMSSRLFIAVRERQGLAYYIRSSISSYFDTGTLAVQAGIDLQRIPRAVESIVAELQKLRDQPVSSKELQKAKEYIKGKTVLALEDTSGMVEWKGMQLLLRNKLHSLDEVFSKIDQVSIEDIQRVAIDLIVDRKLNFAMIAPDQSINSEQLETLLHFS